MLFDLSNAPARFQGYIKKILAQKLEIFVIVHLDNIQVYTEDAGQPHMGAVRCFPEQLRKHSLYANLKNCRFHQDEVWFLGFVVSDQGIRIEEERIEAVKVWAKPKSVRDIKVFLGFANFCRRFIKSFSKIAAPLTFILKTTAVSPKGPPEATGKVSEETENEVADRDKAKIGGVKLPGAKIQRIRQRSKILQSPKLQTPRHPELPPKLGIF